MDALTLYAIFCITTSLCFIYEIAWPVIIIAKNKGIKNSFTEQMTLSLFIFFLINLVLAPIVILSLFIPGAYVQTVTGISKVVNQAE